MKQRMTAATSMPCKNQDICVGIRGKEYYVCSSGQMATLRDNLVIKILHEFRDRGELPPSSDDLPGLIDAEVEETGFATVDMILAKLSPAEQEQWKAQYRFGGLWGGRR